MNEMASQVIGSTVSHVLEIHSFLRGYHAYMESGLLSCCGRNAGVNNKQIYIQWPSTEIHTLL